MLQGNIFGKRKLLAALNLGFKYLIQNINDFGGRRKRLKKKRSGFFAFSFMAVFY